MIHHYTSIKNLALILESRRMRFTRMDQVDDIMEVDGLKNGVAKLAFLSCWTEDSEENIALWKMYTDNMQGIRITLPKNPFRRYYLKKDANVRGVHIREGGVVHLPPDELLSDTFFIFPFFDTVEKDAKTPLFYKKVIYDDNFKQIYEGLVNSVNDNLHQITLAEIGKYKSKKWAFQNESRFTLYGFPLFPLDHPLINGNWNKNMEYVASIIFSENQNFTRDLQYLNYIDVPIDENHINNIEVILGPTCTKSDRIIVESLLEKYTSNSKLSNSSLFGQIRLK